MRTPSEVVTVKVSASGAGFVGRGVRGVALAESAGAEPGAEVAAGGELDAGSSQVQPDTTAPNTIAASAT